MKNRQLYPFKRSFPLFSFYEENLNLWYFLRTRVTKFRLVLVDENGDMYIMAIESFITGYDFLNNV